LCEILCNVQKSVYEEKRLKGNCTAEAGWSQMKVLTMKTVKVLVKKMTDEKAMKSENESEAYRIWNEMAWANENWRINEM